MPRYFLEIAYKGDNYSGFQIQENAATVQSEVEKAFHILQRTPISLTGSSRTDAGVHALQNFFHFDFDANVHAQFGYKMNAILPADISVKRLYLMHPEAHCRFDATSREYIYSLHQFKNPFLSTSLYYPYKLDIGLMQSATEFLKTQTNFFAFSKTNTQVNNFFCTIQQAHWKVKDQEITFFIEANRFLRGMVRLITATILKVGRRNISIDEFQNLFVNQQKCGHSVPATGLFLCRVNFRQNYFSAAELPFTDT